MTRSFSPGQIIMGWVTALTKLCGLVGLIEVLIQTALRSAHYAVSARTTDCTAQSHLEVLTD